MRKAVEKILEKIKRDKRIAAIVCVGLAGIILLTLSVKVRLLQNRG